MNREGGHRGPPERQAGTPAPQSQLDEPRFAALWQRLRLRGDSGPTFQALARAYAEPARAYHNAEHIRDCFEQFDAARDAADQPDEVELALWFHDAVYDSHADDNEERSAAWAADTLARAGAAAEVQDRVRRLVLATQHRSPRSEPDAQLIVDVDLSILGRDPATFDDFERKIRREYAWAPEAAYRAGRAQVLQEFLRRDPLYLTPAFQRRYEIAAKANLRRAIARLGGRA